MALTSPSTMSGGNRGGGRLPSKTSPAGVKPGPAGAILFCCFSAFLIRRPGLAPAQPLPISTTYRPRLQPCTQLTCA